jgi:hypothetical protein
MLRMMKFALRHKGCLGVLALGALAGLAAFAHAIDLDEGKKKHLKKQLAEAREMPLRILT